MCDPDYVTVRRRSDVPFGVLPADLVSEGAPGGEPPGYDLCLMRSMTSEGLTTPITVRPLPDGRFMVIDGLKRLAAIRALVRIDKMAYDSMRGLMRPARRVFDLITCRVQSPATRAGEATRKHQHPGPRSAT